MKAILSEVLNEIRMPTLTIKQRLIVWYFALSFCLLCIGDDSPFWAVFLVVLNFANSARLVRKVPLPDKD